MKIIELTKETYQIVIDKSLDYTFIIPKEETVECKIGISIVMKDSQSKIRLNFVTSDTKKVKIKVLTMIPEESVNNNIEIDLTGIITLDDTEIEFEPSFELYNNSTVVIHSSSVGIIDQKWREYLQSRGLKDDAIVSLFNQSYENRS